MVDCQYKGKCSGEPYQCAICRHNKGKKNYYEPINPYPVIPYKPSKIWVHKGKPMHKELKK